MGRSTKLPENPRDADQAISARLLASAKRQVEHIEDPRERDRARGVAVQRLRRELAYRRLLARLFTTQPESWVLKGGVALLYRLDPNRPSYDIDIAHNDAGVDHSIALRRLETALRTDLGDMLVFELGQPHEMMDEAGAVSVRVTARIGVKEFATFTLDMPQPRDDVPSEPFDVPPADVGYDVLDDVPQFRLLPLVNQISDKVCAMFEQHGADGEGFSSWSRDLADIALIASQQAIDGTALQEALATEVQRRAQARLPDGLPPKFEIGAAQQQQWRNTWTTSARTPPIGFDEALEVATVFLAPVFSDGIDDKRWSPNSKSWD